jgi:hypothetical protein
MSAADTKQLISQIGSERATNDSGKIITHGGFTHVIWQDVTREGYFNRVRSLEHKINQWSTSFDFDQGIDNHARGVMTIDPQGFLHVVLGGHGSAVSWCRSLRPNDSSAWTERQSIGVGTYPIFQCAPDGTLYLTLRGQGPTREDRGVDLYRRPADGEWGPPLRLVQLAAEYGQVYAGFHNQLSIAADGALHAIIDFYEGEDECGRGLHQAVCYVSSPDGGDSWQKADGTAVNLPARPEDMDTLAQNVFSRHEQLPPPEIKHGGLVVDSVGTPFFFYLHHTEAPGKLLAGTVDSNGQIQQQDISHHWEQLWPDMRAVGCWSTIRADDAIFALVLLTPYSPAHEEWIDGRPTRVMNLRERDDQRLVWVSSEDRGQSFSVREFLEPGAVCNCPSLERPVGANVIPADRTPGVLYFDGSNEYPGGGDYYASDSSVAEILAVGGFRANNVWLA